MNRADAAQAVAERLGGGADDERVGAAESPAGGQVDDPTGERVEDAQEAGRTPAEVAALKQESARHRHRARAAEARVAELEAQLAERPVADDHAVVVAERDTLRDRIDKVDRSEVERLAGEVLLDPTDIWILTDIDAMRGDDGEIDVEKVNGEVGRILTAKPHWRAGAAPPTTSIFNGGARPMPEPDESSSEAFSARIRRERHGVVNG